MNEELIKAVKSLLSDIESMKYYQEPNWFGPFEFAQETHDGELIEWPNLAISAAAVRELLDGITIEGSLAAPQLTINNGSSEDTRLTGTRCSYCNEPQFETPSGITCSNGHGGADPAEDGGPLILSFIGGDS